jgi:hypothetical protein
MPNRRASDQGAHWCETMRRLVAQVDPRLQAVLDGLVELAYAQPAEPDDDRPDHVRAASAIRRFGSRLVIVQDDVNVLALRGSDGAVLPILLPRGEARRRMFGDDTHNKHAKMDLEAGVVLPDGRLVAFGSGSTPARERLVVLDTDLGVRVVEAGDLYAQLRACTAFSGAELNVEGAVQLGGVLRLFQRGNGAAREDCETIDATGDLPLAQFVAWLDGGPCPPLHDVVQFDLGTIEGTRACFTDAAALADGRVAFVACAEQSPDTTRDGDVLGCRFGIIDGDRVRITDIVDPQGALARLKIEGLEVRGDDATAFHVVVDMDRGDEPARLGILRVRDDAR